MSSIKAYVAGRQTGSIPRITYSTDLGVTWIPTNFNASAGLIQSIVVKQDDPNFLLVGNTYVSGDTNNQGIQYSTDGGLTWSQSGGTWLGTVTNYSLIGYTNLMVLDSDPLNTIVYTTATDFGGAVRLLRSDDGGYNFKVVNTSNSIYGSGNYIIYALTAFDTNLFVAVGAGTGLNPVRVYKSTNYGGTFSLVGTAGASNNIGALYYDAPTDILYAVTLDGVYASTSGGPFTLVYGAFPNPHFVVGTIKGIDYIDGLFYFNDRTTVYAAGNNFGNITSVYTTGAGNTTDFDFYLMDKGFIIANGVDVLYTANNGVNINNTNTDIDFGPELVTLSPVIGCGCEPGFFWDEASQLCITMTPMCPEGMTYNPTTNQCEGTVAGCDTDVAIVIDVSGSILPEEMPEYKNMLRGIIDGLEMGYDVNGNLNTLTNSLGRITSGEIRVGIVLFNNEVSTPVGGVSLNYGPTAWESGGALNSPAGTVANAGSLKNAINNMGSSIFGNPADVYGIPLTGGIFQTNSFSGLGKGYDVVWGTNSRPGANKKILFVTDGWPNYINPNDPNFYDYGITLPSIITTFGPTPANAVCGTWGSNDINSVIQASYQERRLADYIATMDLAQAIKSGTAVPQTTTGGPTEITLLITGELLEQEIVKTAFVGIDATDLTTPCYLDNSSIFGSGVDSSKDNGATDGSTVSVGSCPSWQGSYTSSSKFPSMAVSGLPDYYKVNLVPSEYANIGSYMSASLICNTTYPAVVCNNPCTIVQDPTTTVYYCNCISSVPFNTCCYDLINCADNTVYASVNTTGQNNDFMAQFIGQYISIEGVAACLYVSLNQSCTSSTTLNITASQITTYADCIDCNQNNEITPYYNLIKCGETNPMLQTTTDLSSYLPGGTNQNLPVLTFVEYPDICFTIQETFTFLPQVTVTVNVAYNDCPTCLSYLC